MRRPKRAWVSRQLLWCETSKIFIYVTRIWQFCFLWNNLLDDWDNEDLKLFKSQKITEKEDSKHFIMYGDSADHTAPAWCQKHPTSSLSLPSWALQQDNSFFFLAGVNVLCFQRNNFRLPIWMIATHSDWEPLSCSPLWQLIQAASSCALRGDGGYKQPGCGPVRSPGRLHQSDEVKSKRIYTPSSAPSFAPNTQSPLDLSLLFVDKVFDPW